MKEKKTNAWLVTIIIINLFALAIYLWVPKKNNNNMHNWVLLYLPIIESVLSIIAGFFSIHSNKINIHNKQKASTRHGNIEQNITNKIKGE